MRFGVLLFCNRVSVYYATMQIKSSDLGDVVVSYPNLQEQQKIANFLSSVDTRIEQLEKKKALLEQYKKGLMQKLFSQEIRFKDDQGEEYPEWIMKKLVDIGKFVGGGTPDTTVNGYWKGDIPWITSADINEGDIHNINIHRYISEDAVRKSATNVLPPNSVIFASRVGIGKVVITNLGICISQDFTGLILETEDLNSFIAYQFQSNKNILIRFSQGTSIKGYTSKDLKGISIFLPVEKEQHKIANFLSSIDKKIELVSGQIKQTREFKMGLLQQMFV